jgi:putative endonuclease
VAVVHDRSNSEQRARGHPRTTPAPRAERSDAGLRARELGVRGEQLASEHFQRLGFEVVARNVRTRAGEIDLIVFDGRTLVFAEVKTTRVQARAGGDEQTPLARLDGAQRARIRRLAAAWLCGPQRRGISARELRLDAVGVRIDAAGRLVRLDHIESAW